MILPYDPFGKNRMVYTIRNHCEEDSSILYDDGATKIYLYTKGTVGNPRQELKDMLKYIQESTVDNITNDDIASLSRLVDKVKHRKGVGINYMKSWEVEEMVRKQGFLDGREQINQLNRLLFEAGRTDDIIKAAQDKAYQELLFQEFNL